MPDDAGYETDFYRWTQEQARLLRLAGAAGAGNSGVDWEDVAEEIESLGRRDRQKVASRLDTIFEHLLKLAYSPSREPRAGWMTTVGRARSDVRRLLKDSPSLRNEVEEWKLERSSDVVNLVSRSLAAHGETDAAASVRASNLSELRTQVMDENFFAEELAMPLE